MVPAKKRNIKPFLIFAIIFITALILSIFLVQKNEAVGAKKIRLLWTNDTHGYLKPLYHKDYYDEDYESLAKKEGKIGGFAHIATLVNKLRNEMPDTTFLFDAGDTWHGTGVPLLEEGKSVVKIMNEMKYDAMAPGNVEFLFPKKVFLARVADSKFPVLALNLSDLEMDELVLKPYVVIDRGGYKLGIMGMAYQWTAKTGERSLTEGWSFGLREKEAANFAKELREKHKADLVILLSHMGKGADLKFASRVNGIDVILGAHTHDVMDPPSEVKNPEGKTVIVTQAGSHGKNLGRLDVYIKDGKIAKYDHQIYRIIAKEIKPDPKIQKIIDEEYAKYKWMEEIIGSTKTMLYRRATWQSTMDNFITDTYRKIENADVAFSPAWRFGATIMPGDITVDDVYNMVPTLDHIFSVELDGESIKMALEQSFDNVIAEDPYLQLGGDMIRFSGIEIRYNTKKPLGERIRILKINGKPFDPAKTYKVVSAAGQIQNHPKGVDKKDTGKVAVETLVDYIKKNSPISSKVDDRIKEDK